MFTLNNVNNKLSAYSESGLRDNNLSQLENYYALLGIDPLGDLGFLEAENYFSNALSLENGLGTKVQQSNKDIPEVADNDVTVFSEDLFLNDIFNNPLTIMDVSKSSGMVFEADSSLLDDLLDTLTGIMGIGTANIEGLFDNPMSSLDNTDMYNTDGNNVETDNIFNDLANILPTPKRQASNEETQEVSDGFIDHFNQGQVGNCWFLAAIDAFTQTAEGRAKLSQSINTDLNGNYNVTFASDPNFDFTVTQAEIEERRQTAGVSYGDIDMQILELAYEKLQASRMEERGLPGIHIWEALSGEKLESSGDRPVREHAEALLKEITGGEGVTKGFGISFGSAVNMATGEAVYYSDTEEGHGYGHSFAITSIDWNTGTMTYENPWDTQNSKTMSLDAFYELLEKGGGFNWTDNRPL